MNILLLVMAAILDGGWGIIHNFESGSTNDHLSSDFWEEDLKVIFFNENMISVNIGGQKKIHRKIWHLRWSIRCHTAAVKTLSYLELNQ